jgi:hypothetical protein
VSDLLFPLHRSDSVTLAQVSEKTGIHIETLRKKAKAGLIPGAFQLSQGDGWRFKRKPLEAWWSSLDGAPGRRRR